MPKLALALSLGFLALGASGPDDPPRTPRDKPRAERAEKAKHAPVVTNEDLPKGEPAQGTLSVATPATPAPGAAKSEASAAAAPEAAPAESAHDEAYWRDRMATAEAKIKRLGDDIVWAKRRITMLRMDLVVPVDGAREFNRRTEIDGILQEQARLEAELAEARQDPARIREEARKEGALPGWFR